MFRREVSDRAQIAATLLPALIATHLKHSDYPYDQTSMIREALEWADALILEDANSE